MQIISIYLPSSLSLSAVVSKHLDPVHSTHCKDDRVSPRCGLRSHRPGLTTGRAQPQLQCRQRHPHHHAGAERRDAFLLQRAQHPDRHQDPDTDLHSALHDPYACHRQCGYSHQRLYQRHVRDDHGLSGCCRQHDFDLRAGCYIYPQCYFGSRWWCVEDEAQLAADLDCNWQAELLVPIHWVKDYLRLLLLEHSYADERDGDDYNSAGRYRKPAMFPRSPSQSLTCL